MIHVYSIMRNESFILPYFLRHYETFADRIFVWEDRSTDDTRAILESHPKVEVFTPRFEGLDDFEMAALFSAEYRSRSRGKADWVACVDADEFVYHQDLPGRLAALKAEGVQIVKLEGWNMIAESRPATGGQIYEEIRWGVPDHYFEKPALFSSEADILFSPGRHWNDGPGATRAGTGIKLLHFRHLGREYCQARHDRNHTRLTARSKAAGHGAHNAPGYHGIHDLDWFARALATRVEVIPCSA